MSLRFGIIPGLLVGVLALGLLPCASGLEIPPNPQRRRSAPSRAGPAFLQQVRSYEETQYVAKAVLRNGARVIVNEMRNDPVVAILLRMESGRLHETEDRLGSTDLLARMFYRSSSSRGSGIAAKDVRALGGTFLSEARRDHTLCWTVVPSAQWKKALQLQLEALLEPRYEEAALKREVELMLGEERRGPMDHRARALVQVTGMTFGTDTSRETALSATSLGSLLELRRRLYSPERVQLVVAGDITTPEVLNEVVRLYAKTAGRSDKPEAPAPRSAPAEMRFTQVRAPLAFPLVSIGFSAPSLRSEDHLPAEVLLQMLARGEGSILARQLRDRRLIRRHHAGLDSSFDRGLLYLQLETDPANTDKCEIALFTELELLKREEPDQFEMARALANLERDYWERLQTVEGRAEALAHFESLGGWKRMEDYLPRLRKVSAADVTRVARKFLTLDNCSIVETLPVSMEDRALTTEVFRKTIEDLLPASADQEQEARERATEMLLDLPAGPGSFRFSEVRHPMRKSSIFRGPDLFIREDHTSPLVSVGVFYPGGRLHEDEKNSGITHLMLNWMLGGGGELSREQMYRQLELFGARIRPVVEEDYFGILFTALSRDTEKSLDLVFQMIKSPKFAQEELERVKAGPIPLAADLMPGYVYRTLQRVLFGEFPYAFDRRGKEETLAAPGSEALLAWHKERVLNRKPLVVIVGDTEGTSLARYFVRSFSGSRFEDVKVPDEFAPPLENRKVHEESWDRNESVVGIAFHAPPAWDEDSYVMTVIESHLKGTGGLLSDELHDRLGTAHAVRAHYEPRLRGGSLTLIATTDPQNETKALEELESLARGLAETPVIYRDYRTALSAAVGEHRIRMQTAEYQISSLVRTVLAGKGIEALEEYPARLESVREADLLPAAQRFLNLDKAAFVRMRGRPVSDAGAQIRN